MQCKVIMYAIKNTALSEFFNGFDENNVPIWSAESFFGYSSLADLMPILQEVLERCLPQHKDHIGATALEPLSPEKNLVLVLNFHYPQEMITKYYSRELNEFIDSIEGATQFSANDEDEIVQYIRMFYTNKTNFLSLVPSDCRNITLYPLPID